MRLFLAAAVLLAAAAPSTHAKPQVSAAELLQGSQNAERYGVDDDGLDADAVDELFGINSNSNSNSNSNHNSASTANDNYSDDDNYNGGSGNNHNAAQQEGAGYTDDVNSENYNGIVDNDYKAPKNQRTTSESNECSYYAEDGYECVPWYLCDEDYGEIINDGGGGLIDIRGNFGVEVVLDPENSKCKAEATDMVCCRNPDFVGEPLKPKPKPYRSRCGNHNANGIGVRVLNDYQEASTQFGEWPHMCAVLQEDNEGKNLYVCGASLISPGIVLTAAHCVDKLYKTAKLKVRCGEWDTQLQSEAAPHQDRYVAYTSVHPGFRANNLVNDIALLHTESEFEISAHVDVICLPSEQDRAQGYEWEKCVATGWGKDNFGKEGQYNVILKQVELGLVSNQECQSALRKSRLGKNFRLDKSFVCAGGYAGIDTCKGDGGGPLVCPSKNPAGGFPQYVQAGIVAWGIGCGEEGYPGVYADVSAQLCFIDFATRCYGGESRDLFGYDASKCRSWFHDARRAHTQQLGKYQARASGLTGRNKARLNKRIQREQDRIRVYDDFLGGCKGGYGSLVQGDSGFQRPDYVDEDDDQYNSNVADYARNGSPDGGSKTSGRSVAADAAGKAAASTDDAEQYRR